MRLSMNIKQSLLIGLDENSGLLGKWVLINDEKQQRYRRRRYCEHRYFLVLDQVQNRTFRLVNSSYSLS